MQWSFNCSWNLALVSERIVIGHFSDTSEVSLRLSIIEDCIVIVRLMSFNCIGGKSTISGLASKYSASRWSLPKLSLIAFLSTVYHLGLRLGTLKKPPHEVSGGHSSELRYTKTCVLYHKAVWKKTSFGCCWKCSFQLSDEPDMKNKLCSPVPVTCYKISRVFSFLSREWHFRHPT